MTSTFSLSQSIDSHRDRIDYVETQTGKYFLPNDQPDDIIIKAIKANRIFEPEVVICARRYITQGSAILDVGSNFGQMAVLFATLAGPSGHVYAFEADDFMYTLLAMNIQANSLPNITPIYGAVYNQDGLELRFPVQDFERFAAYGSYGIQPGATEGRIVHSHMIDSLGPYAPISFMKVDCQGSDLFAMQGARATITQHQMPILFEFEEQFQDDFGTSMADYINFVDEIGYEIAETIMDINFLILPKK